MQGKGHGATMREKLRVEERTLSYLDNGQGEVGRAAGVLVFLHAFPLTAGMWQPQFDEAPPGWRYVAPDLAGFGGSEDRSGKPSIDDYAADVVTLLDHLGANRVVVCGLSMGGYVAFGVLRHASRRVKALVLAGTRADADTAEARTRRAAMMARLREGGVRAVAGEMMPQLVGDTTRRERPEIERTIRGLIEANGPEGIEAAVRRMMDRPDSTPLLSGLEMPVLFVAGEEDRLTPVDIARGMHARVPGSTLATIPSAGHLSNIERPDLFNDALAAFLAGLG